MVGLIHVSSGRDHAFGEREVLFVHRAAKFLATSVQGVRELVAAVKGRIEQMVDHMSDGVVMLDRRGKVVAMNGAARQVLKCEDDVEEQMNASSLAKLLDFDPLGLMEAERRSLRKLVCLGGVPYQVQLSPVTSQDGELTGTVIAFRNFEEEKRVDEMKSEIVNVVSHEVRTPLTAIKNSITLLRGPRLGALTDKQNHFFDLAQRNVGHLISIINDLLDLSKIEAGKMHIDLQLLSPGEPIEAAVSSLKPQAQEKGVTLESSVVSDLPLFHGDAASLQRVLINLLGNAIKFTDPGGRVSVSADVTEDDGTPAVKVTVADSGVGIPQDQLESIFDKFHQVAGEGRLAKAVGTGLGLPISRELIKAHHGRIWAESAEGSGRRLSFVIPVLNDEQMFLRCLKLELGRARDEGSSGVLALARFENAEKIRAELGDDAFSRLLEQLRKAPAASSDDLPTASFCDAIEDRWRSFFRARHLTEASCSRIA